tara:strand:+ start:359 stop:916 length:558 start_codon:yes stop_codon:yes gene_type:complete
LNQIEQDKKELFIGIDPGKSGAIAGIYCVNGKTKEIIVKKCGKNITEMNKNLKLILSLKNSSTNIHCNLELVHAFPKQGVVSTFSFGQNYGQWQGILEANRVNFDLISPQKWIRYYNVPKLEKKNRKQFLYNLAGEMFPQFKITYAICDALLIAEYCRKMKGKYGRQNKHTQRKNETFRKKPIRA